MQSISKFKIIFNWILAVLPLIGFIYQVSLIFYQYSLGRTVVNVDVKLLTNTTLPAITVCYPALLNMRMASELDGKYSDIYMRYTKLVEENKSNNTFINSELKLNMSTIYFMIMGQFSEDNFYKLFQISLPNSFLFRISGNIGSVIGDDYIRPEETFLNSYFILDKPIETINYIKRKCFTQFSAISEYWRSFQIDLKMIEIQGYMNYRLLPPIGNMLLSIHSPNSFPDFSTSNSFIELESSKITEIKYSQIRTELLGGKYDTNCDHYELDDDQAKIRMRSDCILHCYVNRYKQLCNTTGLIASNFLVTKRLSLLLGNSKSLRFCEGKGVPHNSKILSQCEERCRPDCSFNYYIREKTTQPYFANFGIDIWNNFVKIQISHSQMPDVVIRHLPEMTLMSLICDFGGLLGMWLGLSVATISIEFFRFFHRFLIFYQKKTVNNNFNFAFIDRSILLQSSNNMPRVTTS